jgi:PPOX class probable F420-dependent enzyme
MTSALPDPGTAFGQRVRDHLRKERVVWLTTVGRDGTPQPNPVWFVWTGGDEIITYNLPDAHRVAHVTRRPQVGLNFNSDPAADRIVVMRGLAELPDDVPPPDRSPEYLAKYGKAMTELSGDLVTFAATYSRMVRVRITGVRGY